MIVNDGAMNLSTALAGRQLARGDELERIHGIKSGLRALRQAHRPVVSGREFTDRVSD